MGAKCLATAGVVVLASELAKRGGRLGGLVAALPTVTVLSLVWLHLERQPPERIAAHARYTFWYVVPTLPMFLFFPWALARWGFWTALLASALVSTGCFLGLAGITGRFGIQLL